MPFGHGGMYFKLFCYYRGFEITGHKVEGLERDKFSESGGGANWRMNGYILSSDDEELGNKLWRVKHDGRSGEVLHSKGK